MEIRTMEKINCAKCGNEFYRLDNDWCTPCLIEAGEPVPIAPVIRRCGYNNGCRQQVLGNAEHCYYREKVKQNRIQPVTK
ncbi:MAG: hypothetical protein JRC89_11300 [Deltaproteobacteria bacterium]|nr:hypothetical protein [Deltaproteobacteria bacterium]